jgi:hypothetical protein
LKKGPKQDQILTSNIYSSIVIKKSEKRFVFSKRYDENTKGYIRLFDLLNTQPAVLKRRLGLTKWASVEAHKCFHAFIVTLFSFYFLKEII